MFVQSRQANYHRDTQHFSRTCNSSSFLVYGSRRKPVDLTLQTLGVEQKQKQCHYLPPSYRASHTSIYEPLEPNQARTTGLSKGGQRATQTYHRTGKVTQTGMYQCWTSTWHLTMLDIHLACNNAGHPPGM